MQETFWGRYFGAGKRDPSQLCPAPFVRKYFGQMFKEVKCLVLKGFFPREVKRAQFGIVDNLLRI